MRKTMVEKEGSSLSVRRQCVLLGINRNRLKVRSRQLSDKEFEVTHRMDEVALAFPEYGSRRHARTLRREGYDIGRDKVRGLMRLMGLEAIYRRPRTSQPGKGHKIYSYLLRDREVQEPDEVWCADITYIRMSKGFAYLVAVMDWKSRAVLSWKLSNTLESGFCVAAFKEAVQQAGRAPTIFNTDQGSQFTCREWIEVVEGAGSKVSMDGKGRWVDNVFIERLWRAVKHEGVYLWAYENLHDLERALGRWFTQYNGWKPHSSLDWRTPWECYRPQETPRWRKAA